MEFDPVNYLMGKAAGGGGGGRGNAWSTAESVIDDSIVEIETTAKGVTE